MEKCQHGHETCEDCSADELQTLKDALSKERARADRYHEALAAIQLRIRSADARWPDVLQNIDEIAYEALSGLPALLVDRETCPHEWKDIRNEVIESGEMCFKCGALKD